jgi:hypothetical protein
MREHHAAEYLGLKHGGTSKAQSKDARSRAKASTARKATLAKPEVHKTRLQKRPAVAARKEKQKNSAKSVKRA